MAIAVRQRGFLAKTPAPAPARTRFVVASGGGVQALLNDGPAMNVTVDAGNGQRATTQGLVDTGSTISSVDQTLLQQLGAQQNGSEQISDVSGNSTVPTYAVSLSSGGFPLSGGAITVLADGLPPPQQVLLGRDVLANYQFVYDGPSASWLLIASGVPGQRRVPYAVIAGGAIVAAAAAAAYYGRHGRAA